MKPGKTGLTRIIYATGYALKGLRYALKSEAAFRQECAAALLLVPLAFWIGGNSVQRALLIGCWLLVLIVELLNSAVEAAVDRGGDGYHPLAGAAKDLAAAAVFVSLLLASMVWALILVERFF